MKQQQKYARAVMWAATIVVSFAILFPVYWIIISSLTEKTRLFQSPVNYFPSLTLDNYISLFTTIDIKGMIAGTALITVVSMVLSIVLGFMAAYSIVRISFKGSLIVMSFLLMSQLLPATSTIIPLYDFMRTFELVDTYPGVILLYTSNLIPFTVMLFTVFIGQVPISIEEAAFVDGAGWLQTMRHISFPLLRPAIAVMGIINFINCLNEFFVPMIFSIQNINTLSIGITRIPRENQFSMPWERISAMGTIMILPIILFVVIFQEQIMDGLMAGGVKQ